MTMYGYVRVSTAKQSVDRQYRNIQKIYGSLRIYTDIYTGTTQKRPEWEKLLKRIVKGDTIVFDSVSRMSRDADAGYKQWMELYEKGVSLVFLKEHYVDTETYKSRMEKSLDISVNSGNKNADELISTITAAISKYMLGLAKDQIKLAFEQSEKEVEDMRERTREGLVTARINGKQIGRPFGKSFETEKVKKARVSIMANSKDFGGTFNDTQLMKLTGISRATYYELKKELKLEESKYQ